MIREYRARRDGHRRVSPEAAACALKAPVAWRQLRHPAQGLAHGSIEAFSLFLPTAVHVDSGEFVRRGGIDDGGKEAAQVQRDLEIVMQ